MTKKRSRPDAGLDLDDAPLDAAGDAAGDARPPRQDQRPRCPQHGEQMVAYSSNPMYTYYRCPRSTCGCRDKKVRPIGPFQNLYGNGKSGQAA